jgi:hypothetical protein
MRYRPRRLHVLGMILALALLLLLLTHGGLTSGYPPSPYHPVIHTWCCTRSHGISGEEGR